MEMTIPMSPSTAAILPICTPSEADTMKPRPMKGFGNRHPNVAVDVNNLGFLYYNEGSTTKPSGITKRPWLFAAKYTESTTQKLPQTSNNLGSPKETLPPPSPNSRKQSRSHGQTWPRGNHSSEAPNIREYDPMPFMPHQSHSPSISLFSSMDRCC